MAIGLITAQANSILDDLGTTFKYVQLHTGDPGAAGTSNVAAESDRVEVTWASASGGSKSNGADIEWQGVGASEDYTHFSVWSASTSGSCGFTGTITAAPVTANDTFTIPTGSLTISLTTAS